MQKGFFAETLASRPALWQAMLRANTGHPGNGWSCTALPEPGADTLALWLGERPAAVQPAPAETAGFWDFAEESRRLALLDAQSIQRLCRVTGTALHAPAIAGVLQHDAVLALRAELGEDMYHYALYRGRYELGSVRRFFAAMRKPVSGRGGLEQEPAAQGSLGQLCRRHGVMALRLVAVSWPEALVARFARNLPGLAGLPEEALPDLDEAERDEIWRAVKKLLLKEVAPSWAPCFD